MTTWNHRPTWANWRRDEQQRTRTNPRPEMAGRDQEPAVNSAHCRNPGDVRLLCFQGVRAWSCHGADAEGANGGLLLGSPRFAFRLLCALCWFSWLRGCYYDRPPVVAEWRTRLTSSVLKADLASGKISAAEARAKAQQLLSEFRGTLSEVSKDRAAGLCKDG